MKHLQLAHDASGLPKDSQIRFTVSGAGARASVGYWLTPSNDILDEATAVIERNAARDVWSATSNLMDGRTVFAIAHRLPAARDADSIAVMINGKIVGLGSHDELAAAGGSCAALREGLHQ